MRRSKLEHPVAVLRTTLGLGQKELAGMLGRSVSAIQSVEMRRLPLSPALAEILNFQTGASLKWLLDGEPGQPIVDDLGKPFTPETFETRQAEIQSAERRPGTSRSDWILNISWLLLAMQELFSVVLWALRNRKLPLARYRITEFIRGLRQEWGIPINSLRQQGTVKDVFHGHVDYFLAEFQRIFSEQARETPGLDIPEGHYLTGYPGKERLVKMPSAPKKRQK